MRGWSSNRGNVSAFTYQKNRSDIGTLLIESESQCERHRLVSENLKTLVSYIVCRGVLWTIPTFTLSPTSRLNPCMLTGMFGRI